MTLDRAPLKLRAPATRLATMEEVVESEDLVGVILAIATFDPDTYVAIGRVCKLWRNVCRRDASVAIATARGAACLNKRLLMGCLGLTSGEADQLPRSTWPRSDGGFMYVYSSDVVVDAWDRFIGDVDRWHERLAARARRQAAVERVYGPQWRTLQWASGARARGRGVEAY